MDSSFQTRLPVLARCYRDKNCFFFPENIRKPRPLGLQEHGGNHGLVYFRYCSDCYVCCAWEVSFSPEKIMAEEIGPAGTGIQRTEKS